MKKIGHIRENYDLIIEKDEADTRKLTSLVRAGLFDQSKLPLLKRALQKDPSKLTMAERKALLDLLDSLMSEVLHSNQVYSKVKQSVMSDKDLREELANLVSPIDGKQDRPLSSKIDLPYMLIMRRKAVRVYPGNQKVGLYYIEALDRYITVPFGPGVPTMNEGVDWEGAAKSVGSYSDSLRNRVFGKSASGKPSKFKKFAKSNPEMVSRKYYSNPKDPEQVKLSGKAQDTLSGQHWSVRAGFALGQMARGIPHRIKDAISKKPKEASEAPKSVSAPRSQGPWGEKPVQTTPKVSLKAPRVTTGISQTHGERAYNKLKAMNLGAPTAPKVSSVSGKATANFGGSMSAPITAKVSAPKIKTPKAPKIAKPSKEEKRIAKLPGMGDQPKTGDFPQADKKVKTFSTNTQLTQARDLTPLEKKTGTVNPEKQLPRKRYPGIDAKVPGTGPQPSVGKTKLKASFVKKLSEQRKIEEQTAALKVAPYVLRGIGTAAAGTIAAPLATGLGIGVAGKAIHNYITNPKNVSKAKKEREGEAEAGAAFDAKKALLKRQRADDRDAADIASVSGTNPKNISTPTKVEPAKSVPDAAETPATQQVKGADVAPPIEVKAPGQTTTPSTTGAAAGAATAAATGAATAAGVKAVDSTWAKSLAKAKENAAAKSDTKNKNKGSGRPKFPKLPFALPSGGSTGGDDSKTLSPGSFKLKANLVEPKGDVQTGYNKRAESDYRKSLKISENANSEPSFASSTPKPFTMQTKLITPGKKSVVTGYEKKAENDYRKSLREDVLDSLKNMVNDNVKEMQLNIGENTIKINNTIATKIVNVHETLNEDNRKKMRDMLNEGNVSSFKKILDFAVRQ